MTEKLNRVLIVDDDVAVTNYFMVFLMQTELFEPIVVNDSRQVMDLLQDQVIDVIMLDLDMPNLSGIEILNLLRAADISIPVVILTGASDVELAVRAMKNGAFDYLTKPVDEDHLLEILAAAVESQAMQRSLRELAADSTPPVLDHKAAFEHLPTRDPGMLHLLHQAETLADCSLSIFIWGERGCGKRGLARGIHQAGNRNQGPFVALDCTNFPPHEFSSVLFGRGPDWNREQEELPGAMAQACGGTLFLNNIEHMTPQVQLRLNHALQAGEFYRDNSTEILRCDVRYIVSSTQDLTSGQYPESFSRDLLYHVMTNTLKIPPLRERPTDIPLLAEYFLAEGNQVHQKRVTSLAQPLLDQLEKYYFPGNMQELRKLIIAAVGRAQTEELGLENLSAYTRERITLGIYEPTFQPQKLQQMIDEHVKRTLAFCQGDRPRTAQLLGVSETELSELLDH